MQNNANHAIYNFLHKQYKEDEVHLSPQCSQSLCQRFAHSVGFLFLCIGLYPRSAGKIYPPAHLPQLFATANIPGQRFCQQARWHCTSINAIILITNQERLDQTYAQILILDFDSSCCEHRHPHTCIQPTDILCKSHPLLENEFAQTPGSFDDQICISISGSCSSAHESDSAKQCCIARVTN